MYKTLKKQRYQDDAGYAIEPLRKQDMELIRVWRNEQMDILRQQKPLSEADQVKYYDEVIKPSFSEDYPRQILFNILLNDKLIGYGGLTYIDWISKKAEISFIIDTKRNSDKGLLKEDFSHFLKLLLIVTFKELRFHRLLSENYDNRKELIEVLIKHGFILEGILRDHMLKDNKWVNSHIYAILENEALKYV